MKVKSIHALLKFHDSIENIELEPDWYLVLG